jgi:hypothetical protein
MHHFTEKLQRILNIYPIHLENLSFAVEKTIGFNLDGVYIKQGLDALAILHKSEMAVIIDLQA